MSSPTYRIVEAGSDPRERIELAQLLQRVYVAGGFTAPELAARLFTPVEVARRGPILVAIGDGGAIVGMVVCATPDNPYRQVATPEEAEMHLLAVDPDARSRGIGAALCLAFEAKSVSMGFERAVLSTQPAMTSAHGIYARLGWERNADRDWARANRTFMVYEKHLSGTADS